MSTRTERDDLMAYILAGSAVSALIGGRYYAMLAAKSPGYPYVVCSQVSAGPTYTHDQSTPFREDVYQFDVFGESAASVQAVADALRARVEGKKFTQGTTDFGAVFVDTEFDSFEVMTRDDGQSGIYRKTIQIRTLIDT